MFYSMSVRQNGLDILAGVPPVSILGLLLFLIYINDSPDGLKSICKIFADERHYTRKLMT